MIDLDTFDETEYFGFDGNCCAIALALHRLTGWPLFIFGHEDHGFLDDDGPLLSGHAMVLSPRGFVDLKGPKRFEENERWVIKAVSAEDVEDSYGREVARNEDEQVVDYRHRENLKLAIPVAEAIIARYFPNVQALLPFSS